MEQRLRQGGALAAAEWLLAGRAAGTLPLAADLRLADRLGWAMAQDRTLPAEAVRTAADRLGWPEGALSAGWAGALRARLDAERWLQALRRDASSWTRWLAAGVPIAAQMVLGRGKLGAFSRLMGNDLRLRRRYGEYLLHAPALGDQLDPARLEAIGQLLTRQPPKAMMTALGVFGALAMG